MSRTGVSTCLGLTGDDAEQRRHRNDPRAVPRELIGGRYDESFLAALPAGADPCGENGEFHTFVSAGPMFRHDIKIEQGDIVERGGFVTADLFPAATPGAPSRAA